MTHLVGQPVVAIVKANQMMANEQVKLLMKICFSKTDNVYEPVMITMSIRRAEIVPAQDNHPLAISERVTSFQVPLLTLLPINSLAIEEVDIKFDMDVHTHHEVLEEGDHHLFGNISSSPNKSYELTGNITKYKPRDQGENAEDGGGMSIRVSARKLPLPLGVTTLIQAFSKAIHPSDASYKPKDDQQQ